MNRYLQLGFAMLLALATTPLLSQSNSITGRVVDAKDNSQLTGAHVAAVRAEDNFQRDAITDENGFFWIKDLPEGQYHVHISYLGYQTFQQSVMVNEGMNPLKTLSLQPSAIDLEQVQVTEQTLPAIQKGDTTQFNADAFKTNPDANAEDLIKKMPGVVVNGGKVQAQGEDVKEVLVDGKPFFGNDPTAALRNLPAEIIDKIEVFDKQSEQAQFSGVEDGETTKAINIITKVDKRNGQFGKLYGGYGTDDRYQAGGNINIFNGDQRISLIGQSNNINIQNFASEDLLGVLGTSGGGGRGGRRGGGGGRFGGGNSSDFLVNNQSGISQTHAFGINYNDNWGKKLEVSGSYFFNWNENQNNQIINQELINNSSDFSQFYDETTQSTSKNQNHRLNLEFEYDINERNSIRIRPRLSMQMNEGAEQTLGLGFTESATLNTSDYNFSSDLLGIDFSNDILYRHRFEKRGRTFSIRIRTDYSENSGESLLFSSTETFTEPILTDTTDQFNTLDTEGWTYSARLNYSEPVSEKGVLQFDYDATIRKTDSDKTTSDFEEATQDYSQLNEGLTNRFKSNYLTQRLGLGYRHRGESYFLMARLNGQWARLDNEQYFPYQEDFQRDFYNILPFAMLRYNFSKTENLRVFYRTNTDAPSISQLQSVINNSNPLQLQVGNPDLDQSYQHSLFMRYSKTNTENSSVFYALLGGSLTNDYIANSTIIATENTVLDGDVLFQQGARLTQPVNLDGQWSLRSFVTYGIPVKAIKSNLNFNVSGNYQRQPGLIDGQRNFSNNTTVGLGVVLSSNISENIDFTLSSRSNFNTVSNSLNTSQNTQYFNQVSEAGINLIFDGGWVIRTNLSNQLYNGFSDAIDQNFWLWNASIGKKLLPNNRGELSLSVFDILKQNTSIQRNITETYIEDVQTDVLQQYFMLTFTYQLRHFGTPSKEESEERPRWGGRRGWDD